MSRIKRKQFQVAGCAVVMVLASSLATSSAASPGSPGQNTDESMEQGPVRAHTTASDTADAGSTELWQRLSGFDQAKRDNAIIHLEMGTAATKKQANTGKQIVSLWNSGSNGEAIELLRALEETGAPVAVGVAWKRPVPVGTNAAWSGSDVRVGAPRAGTSRVMLAAGRDHILATILWSTGESKGWSMNVSADDGATWSETYHLYHQSTCTCPPEEEPPQTMSMWAMRWVGTRSGPGCLASWSTAPSIPVMVCSWSSTGFRHQLWMSMWTYVRSGTALSASAGFWITERS
ncbi:MAG: hypothetical protein ACYTBJ_12135 [Planctomycetota bacterium]